MKENKKVQQINIELDEKVSGGEYANFVVVTHSLAEVVMDFTRLLPGVAKAKVHSRIIMAPPHAKAYLMALTDNIKKFENVLKSKKRKNCAPPAPACGLYLEKIIY